MRAENRPLHLLLIVVALLALGVLVASGGETVQDHEDPEPEKTPPEKPDPHEGHDEEEEAPDGHDDEKDPHEADDGHEGHDDEKDPHETDDAHEGHDDEKDPHEADDAHEGHDDEVRVELTPAQRERVGLTLMKAGPGSIEVSGTFPGEIVLDPDRVVHVVPRVAGIVREVKKTLGDRVEANDILAWIESDELAEAKLDYYAKQAEVGACMVQVPRAKEIYGNVNRLLALLEKEPELEAVRDLDDLEMGAYRGQLLTAYAEHEAARSAYEQEEALRGKQISSERERVEAAAAFKKAQAGFLAAMDTARFQVGIEYAKAVRLCRVAEFEGAAAEQRLRLKGVGDEVVRKLRAMVPDTGSLEPTTSVVDELAKDEKFAWTALRAPFAGFVIEKHLSLGEKADGEESVFAIADTSSVWVRFSVYQKDLAAVKPGQTVRVTPGAGTGSRKGVVAYLAPTVDETTRTVPARIVLENPDGTLRPGLFATVRVDVGSVRADVVVPRAAVQIVDQREVVFVEDGDGFLAEPVMLGASDRERVVVTSGLRAGQRYVLKGAFELKAKLATSGLGAHAGHGH